MIFSNQEVIDCLLWFLQKRFPKDGWYSKGVNSSGDEYHLCPQEEFTLQVAITLKKKPDSMIVYIDDLKNKREIGSTKVNGEIYQWLDRIISEWRAQ